MISGTIKNPQDLVEILSGIPKTKKGYLSILCRTDFAILEIEKNKVKAFYTNYDEVDFKNPVSFLTFILSEMLRDTQGYFSFEEKTAIEEMTPVDVEVETLLIQSTILRKEIDTILPQIITTNVKFSSEIEEFNDKTLAEILGNSDEPIETLRKLKKLIGEEKVKVSEIKEVGSLQEIGLDYILERVESKKVNLLKLLESLKNSDFTGFVEIEEEGENTYVFLKNGKIFGVYPAKVEIFDKFFYTFGNLRASIVKLKEEFIETFAQSFIGRPSIFSEDKYISLGKLFLSLISLKEEAIVKIVKGKESYIFVFRDGKLFSAKKTKRWEENWDVLFNSPVYLFFFKDIYTTNVNYLFYLLLLNKLKGIIRKYNLQEIFNELLLEIASLPFLYIENELIKSNRILTKKEESILLKVFVEISDKVIEKIGKEKFEEDLENELSAYKDILKVLDFREEIYKREEIFDNL